MNMKIRLIDISKALITILIVYEQWYLYKFGPISNLLQILAIAIVLVTVLASPSSFLLMVKEKTFVCWAAFGISSLLFSVLLSSFPIYAISSLKTYFSFLIVCLCAGMVTVYDKNRIWFQNALIIVCILCAFSTIISPFHYKNEGYYVITMSELNNPNNLGFMMSIGIFSLILPEKKQGKIAWIIRLILTVVFLYVIVNTGSRSSLLCAIAVILLSIYFNYKYTSSYGSEKIIKRLIIIGLVIMGVVSAFIVISHLELSGNGVSRLLERFNKNAFVDRGSLYIMAWDIFKKNFIFGVGYNCFSVASGTGLFTHSTYMELLSCTGILGTLLYIYPILSELVYSIRTIKEDRKDKITVIILMFVSGFFGITYYTIVFMMTLYIYLIEVKKIDNKREGKPLIMSTI